MAANKPAPENPNDWILESLIISFRDAGNVTWTAEEDDLADYQISENGTVLILNSQGRVIYVVNALSWIGIEPKEVRAS